MTHFSIVMKELCAVAVLILFCSAMILWAGIV
jgi:hypothetical protein